MTRTDIHRPSLIDPAEYTFMAAFYQGASEAMMKAYAHDMREYDAALAAHPVFDGNYSAKLTCDHCGAAFNHGALFLHIPTNRLVHVGHICADNTVGLPSRAAAVRKQAERAAAEENDRIKRHKANAQWQAENADVVTFLNDTAMAEVAYRDAPKPTTLRAPHPFLNDMVHTFNKWGNLSERQTAAVRKFMVKAVEFAQRDAERQAEREAEVAASEPLAEGRRLITGIILSTKWQESMYGTTPKMLVKQADGNKVWGTVPDAAFEYSPAGTLTLDDLKGREVEFTATVERSQDDEHFGFYKRPTGIKTKEVVA